MNNWHDLWPRTITELMFSLDIVSTLCLTIIITILLLFKEKDR